MSGARRQAEGAKQFHRPPGASRRGVPAIICGSTTFSSAENSEQVVELIDEADRVAPDRGAFGIRQRAGIPSLDDHRSAVGLFQQPGQMQQRRFPCS